MLMRTSVTLFIILREQFTTARLLHLTAGPEGCSHQGVRQDEGQVTAGQGRNLQAGWVLGSLPSLLVLFRWSVKSGRSGFFIQPSGHLLEGEGRLACSPGQRGNWFMVVLQRMSICWAEQDIYIKLKYQTVRSRSLTSWTFACGVESW